MFQRLFGGGRQDAPPPPASAKTTANAVSAIQNIAEQVELLEERKLYIEKKIEAEVAKAKACMSQGNKSGAMSALKKKALLTKQLEGQDNNIMRLLEQQSMLESAQVNAQTMAAMKHGAKAQKAAMQEYKVENVYQVFDEIQEVADQSAEIQEAMAQPLGGAAALDEDELEAELAEMQAAALDEELMQPAPIPTKLPGRADAALNLPSVPSAPPSKVKKTAEDELAELEAEMAA